MEWENRSFRTEMESMAGELQTFPAQATVMILGLSPSLPQLTITAGMGYNILPGRQISFAIG
jgi:hypothetical protein